VIQPDQRARLPFDAPNRFCVLGRFCGSLSHYTLPPVIDVHTGFPYSVENQERQYIGPRKCPAVSGVSLPSICRCRKRIKLPLIDKHAQVGFNVFNILNHFNPRDVQNDIDSHRFGQRIQRRRPDIPRKIRSGVLT